VDTGVEAAADAADAGIGGAPLGAVRGMARCAAFTDRTVFWPTASGSMASVKVPTIAIITATASTPESKKIPF
jgi:hypothetical protein